MGYISRFYLQPFLHASRRWKVYLYTLLWEIIFIALMVVISVSLLGNLQKYAAALDDNELDDRMVFLANVQNYNSELGSYLDNLYMISFLIILSFFVLYSVSRYFIWRDILDQKLSIWRSLAVDAIAFFAAFFILVICLNLIKPSYYSAFIGFTILPLMYYSFFMHSSTAHQSVKGMMKSAVSIRMILVLPHTILAVVLSIFLWANLGYIGLAMALLVMNFFRIYAVEVCNQMKISRKDAD